MGGLYRVFPSKEAIVLALQQRAVANLASWHEAFTARAAALAANSPPDLASLRVVIASFDAYLAHRDAAPEDHALIATFLAAAAPVLSDPAAREVDDAIEPLLDRCAGALEAAVGHCALAQGEPRVRAQALWAAMVGLDQLTKRDRLSPPELGTRALREVLWRGLLVGWGADPALVETALG